MCPSLVLPHPLPLSLPPPHPLPHILPPSPGLSAITPGMTAGEEALSTFDFYTSWDWYWGGIGYLWGSAALFVGASTLALTYLSSEAGVWEV